MRRWRSRRWSKASTCWSCHRVSYVRKDHLLFHRSFVRSAFFPPLSAFIITSDSPSAYVLSKFTQKISQERAKLLRFKLSRGSSGHEFLGSGAATRAATARQATILQVNFPARWDASAGAVSRLKNRPKLNKSSKTKDRRMPGYDKENSCLNVRRN